MDQWDQELRERARSEPFPLPKGYAQRLRATLANLPEGGERRRRPRFRAAALAAAAALAVFLVLPNVSPTVAYAMEDVPVLGAIVRVITLRNYDQEDETRSLHVQIPELQGAGEAGEAINEEVSAYVDALLAAFETGCEAGGVRALDVRYAVVTDAQDWFTLRVDATLAAGSSEEISRFYHIDKRSGALVLVFDEYTIASGFMGMPEFSIPASMVEALQNG